MSLNLEFQKNPIMFLRKHALSPPDGSPGQVIKSWWVPNDGNIIEGFTNTNDSKISLKRAGISRMYSSFRPHGLLPGALTVSLSPARTSGDDFSQFWLPWESLSVTRCKLPPSPSSIVGGNEDYDKFPRFFMTAGITGCSIFVDGPSHCPTVYHAGITGKLARPSDEFWKEQLEEALSSNGVRGIPPKAQVHKREYMQMNSPAIQRYLRWKESSVSSPYKLSVMSCFGSVVGVRFGRSWSFYLQENVLVQDIQILKRSKVEKVEYEGDDTTFYRLKKTKEKVDVEKQIQHRRFLPDKEVKVFTRKLNVKCECVRVSEIYPTRTFSAELKDFEVVGV